MSKNSKNNLIVKFVQITKDFAPKFIETKQNDYILFGEDNQLPYLLTDLYGSVSLHKGIIQKKNNMIKAKGLYFDDDLKTLNFFDNVNENENMEELFDKIVSDFTVYGGTYLQIIWSRDGKQINKMYHMPFEQMRVGKIVDNDSESVYYYNESTDKYKKYKKYTKSSDLKELEAFGNINKKEPQIYYIKQSDVSNKYYGVPDYSASITDLDTFRSISEFHNSNIHNGMQPSYVVMFKGVNPSPEKQDAIVEQIKSKYTGIENSGKPLIFFLDDGGEPIIQTIESSEVDKMFDTLYQNTRDNIITAHQIPRILANVSTEGSLGGSKEYVDAENIFNRNYIQPIQDFLLKKINIIFEINGLKELKIKKVEPDLSIYSIDELLKIYTADEIKELLGLPTIKKQ